LFKASLVWVHVEIIKLPGVGFILKQSCVWRPRKFCSICTIHLIQRFPCVISTLRKCIQHEFTIRFEHSVHSSNSLWIGSIFAHQFVSLRPIQLRYHWFLARNGHQQQKNRTNRTKHGIPLYPVPLPNARGGYIRRITVRASPLTLPLPALASALGIDMHRFKRTAVGRSPFQAAAGFRLSAGRLEGRLNPGPPLLTVYTNPSILL
jgi:hypothetical protein